MTRLRTLTLSVTLSVLATGCYTQLRAPHANQHYRERHIPPSLIQPGPVRHSHVPVFHLPAYDHHDWWLYGDAYCDVWVGRYYDYHPWIPRITTHIRFDRHGYDYLDYGGGDYRHHRRPRFQVWQTIHRRIRPRWRHHGPRFEPLSPTVEVEVVVVERRGRFRRDGFAGGVPGRHAGADLVTMRTASSVTVAEDGSELSRTVRITRPGKLGKSFTRNTAVAPVDRPEAVSSAAPDLSKEGSWGIWGEGTQTPSPEVTVQKGRDVWDDSGRDVKSWGPVTEVRERSAKQPKPQTNWFNPNAGSASDDSKTPEVSRGQKPQRSWEPLKPVAKEKPTQVWNPNRTEPTDGTKPSSTATWSVEKNPERRSSYALPRKDEKRKKEVTPTVTTRRNATPEPKPTRSWSTLEIQKEPERKPTYASPPKHVRKRQEVRRLQETRRPAVREPKPEPSRTWAQTKVEKKPEPKRSYVSPPRKQERKRDEVKRSSSSRSRSQAKPSKQVKKKEEPKKETKKTEKKDRQGKRDKSRRRKGM
jgi:hypothetical protein